MKANYESAAVDSKNIWQSSLESAKHGSPDDYSYIKQIIPYGARYGKYYDDTPSMIIPLQNAEGEIRSLQYIFKKDGECAKRFHYLGQKQGCFFLIGTISEHETVYICEGYATGCSIHEATGTPVVVSFDCNNLRPVTEEMQRQYPNHQIVITADNDHKTEGNPGLTAEKEIAEKLGCSYVSPIFSDLECAIVPHPTDFNDLGKLKGLEELKNQIEQNQSQAWRFTILGHNPSREVVLWYGGKVEKIKSSQIRTDDLKILFDTNIDGERASELKNQIIQQSKRRIIRLEQAIKSGIWKFGSKFVLISGSRILELDGSHTKSVYEPVVNEKVVEFTEDWIDIEQLEPIYHQESNLKEVFLTIQDHVSAWNWKNPRRLLLCNSTVDVIPVSSCDAMESLESDMWSQGGVKNIIF